ncbi:MAG: 50S ribosomal protein L20 [Patescibacteria group bacterium]|nr:50S ribosomal protein L20 [Patescibacteria group bacterium]
MVRVKGGKVTRRRHKKILKSTKGYRLTKSKLYKVAHEAYLHAGQYSYNHRKKRLNQFRRLWISRINAAVRQEGLTYNTFINNLKGKKIQLNRHVLAELAVNFPETFSAVVEFSSH